LQAAESAIADQYAAQMMSNGSFASNGAQIGISTSFRNGITHGNSVSAAISGSSGNVGPSTEHYDKVRNSYQSPKFTNTNIQNEMMSNVQGYHTTTTKSPKMSHMGKMKISNNQYISSGNMGSKGKNVRIVLVGNNGGKLKQGSMAD
jgi:hypothetical protein